jgi:hypothetical protein
MSLTYGKSGEKAIAAEKAPGASIEESWCGRRDGCITFVKNGEKVVELGARSRQGCAADLC